MSHPRREQITSSTPLPPTSAPHTSVGMPFGHRMGFTHVGILTVAHLFFDFVLNILPPLLPFLVRDLGLSVTLMGTVLSARSLASGMGQPLYGYLIDRYGRGWMLPALILWTGAFTACIGFSQGYGQLLLCALLLGLGGGIFHPLGTLMVQGARQERSAGLLSIFSLGGTIGMAAVPLATVFLVSRFGLQGLGWLLVPTLALFGATLFMRTYRVPLGLVTPAPGRKGSRAASGEHSERSEGNTDERAGETIPTETSAGRDSGGTSTNPMAARRLTYLTIGILMRNQAHLALASFLPLYFVAGGRSEAFGGAMLTLYLSVGAASSIFSSYLSDRYGRRRVTIISQLLIAPGMLLFFYVGGWWSIAALALTAAAIYATFSAGVIYAQELMPERPGMSGSLIMGFAGGVAGIGVTAIGAVADVVGLADTLYWLSFVPLLGLPLLWRLPETVKGGKAARTP